MKNLILILSVLLSSSAFAQGPPTIIYGTAGNDVMLFQGNLQQLTIAITNAYSGEVVFLDDDYNRTSYAYDGLSGTDTMAFTNMKDAAFLQNTNGYQMFYNIERFIFSDGDDIAELASTNFVLGNVFMDGGRGNDILWANWGNDTIRGGDGNDIIDGGPGDDVLDGQNGDDVVSGGDGNDSISPGLGMDALFGNDGDDTFFFAADGTNASGINIILDTCDGGSGNDTIYLTSGSDYLSLRDTNSIQVIFDIEEFFLGSGNDVLDLSDASIVLSNLTIYGEAGNDLIIANAGDDYIDAGNSNDVVQGGMGNDYILGGAGSDILDGGPGNDTIRGGAGADQAWGGDGDDTFFATAPEAANDELDGGDGADTLDVSEILTGFNPATSDPDLFVRIVPLTVGEFEFEVQVNTDGDLGGAFALIARIRSIEFIELSPGSLIVIPRIPEIVVEQPVSTDIANGGTNSFGTVAAGSNTNLTFTIRNLGAGELNLTGTPKAQMSGANAADFTVTLQPMTPVAFNHTTTFEVSFAPSATGLRTALITIANNDTNENPFEITLTGTGVSIAPSVTSQPQNRTNVVGTLANFAVTASGTAPLSYQWRWNGTNLTDVGNISGSTTNELMLTNVQLADAGDYDVIITNTHGSVTSLVATLTVICPQIMLSPAALPGGTVGVAYNQTLTANGGTSPYTFAITSGSLPDGLDLSSGGEISGTPTNTGDFIFTATAADTNGCVGSSNYSVVISCPAITLSPTNLPDAVTGAAYNQSLSASGGSAPYSYAVTSGALPGGLDLSGAGDLTGTATNIGMFNFTVTGTDTNGCTGQQAYALTVLGAPQITSQPQNLTNLIGTLAGFAVTASGTAPLHYQWWKDAAPLSCETNGTYTIASVSTNDTADYFVVVTNVAGSVTSAVATLTVWVPPMITSDPVSATNLAGSTVMFSATVEGMEPLTYRWLKDGGPLSDGGNVSGTDTPTLTLTNLSVSDAADYSLWVTNVAGSVTSQVAVLTVVAPPEITSQPQSTTNYVGEMVLLSVTADGTEPLRYQWWKDSAPVSDETNNTFSITSADLTNAGDYVVVVTNDYGSVTSEVASLTVVVSNSPGIDIVWTNTFGGSWHVAANWSPNLVPRPQDSATIGLAVTVSVNSAATVSNLTFSSATLSGSGVLSIGGVMAWESGKLSGKLAIAPEGILNVTNNTIVFLDGCSLTNYGTVTWTGADHLYVGNNAAVHNEGLWEIQTDNDIIYWSGVLPSFSNAGTFRKTGGSGDTSINIGFTTTGQVEVQQGTLSIYAWLGDSTLHGTLRGSASMSPGPSLTVASNAIWNWSGGTVSGAVAIASNGVCNWLGGTLGGNLDVAPGGTLNLTNSTIIFMDGGTLTNRGAVLWTGDMFYVGNSAAIHNEGLWEIQTDSDIVYWSGLRPNLVNVGTLSKTGSGGITAVGAKFTTTGTMDIQTGWLDIRNWTGTSTVHGTLNWIGDLDTALIVAADGTLNLGNDANYSLTQCAWTNFGTVVWDECTIHTYADSVIHNAGLWLATYDNALWSDSDSTNDFINAGMFRKTDGFEASIVDWNFTNHGTNEVLSGALWLKGAAVQVGGLTFVGGGELYLDEAFELNGGWLLGTNAILGDVINNGGTVGPGASPGLLSIDGDYVQTAAGTLAIELAGHAAGTGYDRLAVSGSAQLDGTLSITVTDSFAPTNNSTFTFLTAGSRSGTFATFHYPSNTFGMEAGYTANSVLVVITNVASVVPVLTEPPFLGSGDIVARFSGMPGESYTIEWTPGLSPANWQKAVNLTAPATDLGLGVGVFEFREAALPGEQRFYRAAHPAY